jgi:hypothetical protein
VKQKTKNLGHPQCRYHFDNFLLAADFQKIPSNNNLWMLQSPPSRSHSVNTTILILAQPRLLRVTPMIVNDEINKQANHDQTKRDRIQPVNLEMKYLNTDHGTPKVAREQTNVEKGSAAHAEHKRRDRVEDKEQQVKADDVTYDSSRPRGVLETLSVEDTSLSTVDEHAPERKHTYHLVHGTFANKELLQDVGEAIEGGAEKCEEVTFELVLGRELVCARDVVRYHEQADPTDTGKDSNYLRELVVDVEEDEGYDDDDYDGPKVDELRR